MSLLKQSRANKNNTKHSSAIDPYAVAEDWYFDRYQIQQVIANRWQLAFWLQLAFSGALIIGILCLLPLKSWEPIVIQRNSITGEVWVDPGRTHYLPQNSAEIESNLVRYVVARETYSSIDAAARFQQIIFSSSSDIAKAYENSIDPHNVTSSAALLGNNGLRIVKVEDVIFLDAAETLAHHHSKHTPLPKLAKVDFITTDTVGEVTTQHTWVATISWEYLGTPNDKEAAWVNWNGFTVTSYRVDQRNV